MAMMKMSKDFEEFLKLLSEKKVDYLPINELITNKIIKC